ncbi:MAG: 16S rRNA (guanine(527)-N(7))-methyltransferase RsmG [Firmicutes bacterium]|nr:16S rRNA (guanine(527)-N(7))-methyltransferase RsmG [Bacillota bacterium]
MQIETPSQILVKGASSMDLSLNEKQLRQFQLYLRELKAWNQHFNLTAINEDRDIVIKHFLDSIAILSKFNIPEECTTVDIGAGAGFPGIPVKILRPDIQLTLIESSQKKARFLAHVIELLDLKDAWVYNGRAEDFGRKKENRERFSLAVSRAVANLTVAVEYALPLLKVGGRFVIYKATHVLEEVSGAEKAIKLLGGRVEEIAKVVIPFLQAERYLVSIVKAAPSPRGYPRKAGLPTKRPLT